MERITKEKLPEILTEEVIVILAEMSLEFPQSKEWHEVFDVLNERGQLMIVFDEARLIAKSIAQAKEDSKTEEQKRIEAKQKEEFYKNLDPTKFYGNMGEPETPQQYKDKYGVWPPGYNQ